MIILRSLDDVGKVSQRLRDAWEAQGGKPLELTLKRYRPKRSLDQNARLHWMHGHVAKRLNELQGEMVAQVQDSLAMDIDIDAGALAALRHPWTKDAVHDLIFKPRFCGGKSSTRLSKMEMVDAQTEYEVWAVEIGVVFPEVSHEG